MADENDKNAYSTHYGPGKHQRLFPHGWLNPRMLLPAIVCTQQKRTPHLSFVPRLSLRERFSAWIRYYSIQWRWDIERSMARLLHRRWTG
jgi:hypothetical protein